jgi:hypothetical protein
VERLHGGQTKSLPPREAAELLEMDLGVLAVPVEAHEEGKRSGPIFYEVAAAGLGGKHPGEGPCLRHQAILPARGAKPLLSLDFTASNKSELAPGVMRITRATQ